MNANMLSVKEYVTVARTRTGAHASLALTRFAEQLRERIGAQQVLLFGSQARGEGRSDSDYDLIIVSPAFDHIHPLDRGLGLRELFYESGGYAPLDLICLTPAEFERARQSISLVSTVLPEATDLLR